MSTISKAKRRFEGALKGRPEAAATELRDVDFLGVPYRVRVHGLMSDRQYGAAREDEFIQQVLDESWSVLAYIGASYGLAPMRLARGRRVLAFEPVGCIFDAMLENIDLSGVSGILPLRLGVAATEGLVRISHSGHTGATPSMLTESATVDELIATTTLASDVFQGVDALLMDIEGLEWDVLVNGPDVPASVRLVALELHRSYIGEEKTTEVVDRLERQGFVTAPVDERGGQEHLIFRR